MKPADICMNCDERIKKQAIILAKQVDSIGRKLERERKRMKEEPLTIEYDHGGGQSGITANPYYANYTKLLKSYTQGISVLIDLIGDSNPAAVATLTELRTRFKVIA